MAEHDDIGVISLRRAVSLFLMLFLALASLPAFADELVEGARGEEVERFQQRLADLGYLDGSVDGIFGKQTTEAVSAFQDLNGLTVTGLVDADTRETVFGAQARSLRVSYARGDEGDGVRLLQEHIVFLGFLTDDADGRLERRLHALGYLDGESDSVFDSYTESVVRAFQQAAGLDATGVADRATIDAAFSTDAPVAERFVAHDIYSGDEGEAVTAVQRAMAQYGMLAAEPDGVYGSDTEEALERFYDHLFENGSPYAENFAMYDGVSASAQDLLATEDFFFYHGDIEHGDTGEDVERLQRRLYTLYYISKGVMDGKVGDKTEAAIREFQKNNRLEETGVANEETQRALFSANAVAKNTKYKLVVRISEQRVYVYGLNSFGEYELDRDFICSTGLGNSTPPGIYTTSTEPLSRWQYFQKFKCWAQYSFRITGDIWFHSVLYDAPDTSTLRYGSVYALGQKASHGCVRLRVEDAKWIYENCGDGTIVVVQ